MRNSQKGLFFAEQGKTALKNTEKELMRRLGANIILMLEVTCEMVGIF